MAGGLTEMMAAGEAEAPLTGLTLDRIIVESSECIRHGQIDAAMRADKLHEQGPAGAVSLFLEWQRLRNR